MKIYTLKDPNTDEIRYVGVTTTTLNQRLSAHIYDAKHKKGRHVLNWIKTVLNTNKRPIIELLEEVDDAVWEIMERYWISQFKSWGYKLTNTDKGGKGVITKDKRSKDSITRSSEAKYRPVYQLTPYGEFIKEFKSIKDACNELNLTHSNISNSLIYNRMANDYYFCYKEKFDELYQNELAIRRYEIKQKRYSLVS